MLLSLSPQVQDVRATYPPIHLIAKSVVSQALPRPSLAQTAVVTVCPSYSHYVPFDANLGL